MRERAPIFGRAASFLLAACFLAGAAGNGDANAQACFRAMAGEFAHGRSR